MKDNRYRLGRGRNPYKKKVSLLIKLIGELITTEGELKREDVVERLRRVYERNNIEPFRGKAKPPDLYDKEMASLYIVGKYGLRLHEEFQDLFNKIFYKEQLYEKITELLLRENMSKDTIRSLILGLLGGEFDANTLARVMRIALTASSLGFMDEDMVFKLLKRILEVFPEHEPTVRKYIRFFIAFKIAERIAKGVIRDRITKEAHKQSLGLVAPLQRSIPDDEYVYSIAREVFHVPDHVLNNILSVRKERR